MRTFGYRLAVVMILSATRFAMANDAFAENFEFTGQAAYEGRLFTQQPQFDHQFSGLQNSILLKLGLAFEANDGNTQASLIPFLRVDSRDQNRTHWDLREAYLRVTEGDWEVLAGFNSVFWGTTESRHLVNIVNQVDTLEDIDQEDFLGQPMVQVAAQKDWGRLEGFLLPGFRGQRFPGNNGRLRSSLPIEDGFSRAELGFVDSGVDVALRYSHVLGDWDLGLSYFHGNSREARFETASDFQSFKPVYDTINQSGLDLQYTTDAWLWKFEGIVHEGHGPTFAALVAGFEYTLFQVYETDADIGFLGEYLYDGRDQTQAPATSFDDDVFLGLRVSLNDVDDTNLLAGAVIDRLTRATALSIEFERRLTDSVKFELESRIFANTDEEGPLTLISDDDFVLARLSFFF